MPLFKTGVCSEALKLVWFCSVEISDINYILVFRNGRNKDQRPSYVPTNTTIQCQLSRLVLA